MLKIWGEANILKCNHKQNILPDNTANSRLSDLLSKCIR